MLELISFTIYILVTIRIRLYLIYFILIHLNYLTRRVSTGISQNPWAVIRGAFNAPRRRGGKHKSVLYIYSIVQ